MGRTRIRLLLAAALLIPILLYWGTAQTPSEIGSASAPDAGIDLFMTAPVMVQYDLEGNVSQQLTAKEVHHQQTNSYFKQPQLIRYQVDKPPVKINAQSGIMDDDQQQVFLEGKVRIQNNVLSGGVRQLRTEQLTYYPQKDYAETDVPVTLLAPGHHVTAIGLQADLKNGRMDLLSEVKGLHNNGQ